MYTRCPQCKTVHPLTTLLISHSRGLVQCGQCSCTFNVLDFLFDDWPSGRAHGSVNNPDIAPPVLGATKEAAGSASIMSARTDAPADTNQQPSRFTWRQAIVLLVLVTTVNAVWTFREPLLEIPLVSAGLEKVGWLTADQNGLLKDPQQIQLVSRDMHMHPTRTGVLVLSLTIINLAPRSQVFPDLEVTLLDADSEPVAQRRLQPADYLRPDTDIRAGLAADVYLPVLLELGDPGQQAVGFEIRFL
jgi:predicted Zn finger-like uncharacterized protein